MFKSNYLTRNLSVNDRKEVGSSGVPVQPIFEVLSKPLPSLTTALANSCIGSYDHSSNNNNDNNTVNSNTDVNNCNKINNDNSATTATIDAKYELSVNKTTSENKDKVRGHGKFSSGGNSTSNSSNNNANSTTMTIPLPRSKRAEERQHRTTSGTTTIDDHKCTTTTTLLPHAHDET